MPNIGAQAPDFTLLNQHNEPVTLSHLIGQKMIVLFFYPKDHSAGCTLEVCAFRDHYEIFHQAGAEVIGISSDSVASHAAFARRLKVPFTLLSDPGGKVRQLWDVPRSFIFLQGRVTYVINKQGFIQHMFNSQMNLFGHVHEALAVLKIDQRQAGEWTLQRAE